LTSAEERTYKLTDKVGITSVDQNWDLLKNPRHEAVEWLHPVTLEQEVSVDVKVTRIIAANFSSEGLQDLVSVQVLADIPKGRVAKITLVLTLAADIINVLAGSLIRTDHSIVAVDAGRDARPNALTVVAVLNETLAARKRVVHSLAFAFRENSFVSTISASHWSVILVLCQAISETIAYSGNCLKKSVRRA
jgi:hypothetical protein